MESKLITITQERFEKKRDLIIQFLIEVTSFFTGAANSDLANLVENVIAILRSMQNSIESISFQYGFTHNYVSTQKYITSRFFQIKDIFKRFIENAIPPDPSIKRHFKEKVWEELMQVVWSPKRMKYWMHELDNLDEIEL
jgi:hypothetical protein